MIAFFAYDFEFDTKIHFTQLIFIFISQQGYDRTKQVILQNIEEKVG